MLVDAEGGVLAARARVTALALGYRDVRVLDGGLAGRGPADGARHQRAEQGLR